MTPFIGLVIAILAGLLAPHRRAVIVSTLIPMIAATGVQSWYLGDGRGHQPPSTIEQVSYWVVQVLIIAIITALALGVYRLRTRRATQGTPSGRERLTGSSGANVLAISTVALVIVEVLAYLSAGSGRHAHRHAALPWTGELGMALGLAAVAALSVVIVFRRRSRAPLSVGV